MFWVYLTVILVVLIMVVFVVLLIKRLVVIMGSQIRKNAMRQLGRYSNLLDKKSKELNDIEERLSEVSACKVIYGRNEPQREVGSVAVIGLNQAGGNTRVNLPMQYKLLKKLIVLDLSPFLEQVRGDKGPVNAEKTKKKIVNFLNKMDFETIYDLLKETSEEQQRKIVMLAGDTAKDLLKIYQENNYNSSFELQDFLFYIKQLDREYDGSISLEASENVEIPEDIQITVLPELLEGIRIKRFGRIYDFAISRREIGL